MAFLISLGVQITPQLLSIVSLTIMPMLKTIMVPYLSYLRYITIFKINYIGYIMIIYLFQSVSNDLAHLNDQKNIKD